MQGRGRGHRGRWRAAARRPVRFLEPTLLLLLHHAPAHGYTLIDQLGRFNLSDVDPSAVYRVLRDMEERGWVTSLWEEEETQGPPRRVYRLTSMGDEVLTWWIEDLQESGEMIEEILAAYAWHMETGKGEYH